MASDTEFNFSAKVDFEWIPGSMVKLFQEPGIGKVLDEQGTKIYNKAMSLTPKPGPGMRNKNYYKNTYKGGRLNIWRTRVNTGNFLSRRYNLSHNVLLKSMRG